MARIQVAPGVALHCEATGAGVPVVFLHEFAGDHRTWEPQVRHFSRSHRCVTFSARGYPPSDIPSDPALYSQDIARRDALAVMDALEIERAHIVGHSMGAYTALHLGISNPERCLSVTAAGCGWGSDPADTPKVVQTCTDIARLFRDNDMATAAAQYARAPMRLTFIAKDPRGFAEFEQMLAQHSGPGSALVMEQVQARRPSLGEMAPALQAMEVPLLVIVGDEDFPCIEGSLLLKRTVPSAALLMLPRTGHTVTSEEPAAFNAALAELFCAAESGTWMRHHASSGA